MKNKTHPNHEKLQILMFPAITLGLLAGLVATIWGIQLFVG